jgi:oligosaccharide repeat unit polymerase
MFSLIISTLNPYGLYAVSGRTYTILLINVLAFVAGFMLMGRRKLYPQNFSYQSERIIVNIQKLINNKLWIAIIFAYLLFVLYLIYIQGEMLLLYEYSDFARDVDLLFEDMGDWTSTVYKLIIPVLSNIIMFLFAYMLLYYRNRRHMILYFLCIVLKSFIGGSRLSIFLIVVYIIALIIFKDILSQNDKTRNPAKRKYGSYLSLFLICSIVYLLMAYATAARKGELLFTKENIAYGCEILNENFVTYSTGPFRAFDYAMQHDYISYVGGYQYGRSTFSGLEEFINMFTRRIGLPIETITAKTFAHQQEEIIRISNKDILFNYAYTNAMIYYYDMGIFGVLIFSFIFGICARMSILIMYKRLTIASILLVCFIFYTMIHSPFTWYLGQSWTYFYLIVLFVMHKFSNKKLVGLRMHYAKIDRI